MSRFIPAALIALGFVVHPLLVRAERPPERVGTIAVSYRDLDLRKEGDARILLTRLEHAAFTACGGNPKQHFTYESTPDRTVAVFQACRRAAVARAVAAIDAPVLSQIFARERKVL